MNVLDKREYFYGKKKDKENLKNYGYKFLEEKYINDAMECFLLSQEKEGIEKIKELSLEKGDFFLMDKISKELEIKKEEWDLLANNALEQGKIHFALRAFEKSENKEKVNEINEKLEKEKFSKSKN